jgi:ribosome-binding protein aMBF1 (putative translation factor)
MGIVENDNDGHEPFAEALSQVVKNARLRRGMSIADLAHKTKLSPLVLELIESGCFVTPICDLERIARAHSHSGAAAFLKAAWMLQDCSAEEAVAS